MKTATIARQSMFPRILLLSVLAYESAGCFSGGAMLMIRPDGSLMKMPVEIMHGVFSDFFYPGLILLFLGILNLIAFISVIRKRENAWLSAGLGLGGLLIWFWVEIAVLGELHWLHIMWGLPVVAGAVAMVPLMPDAIKQRILLISGILSSVLYAVINIIVAAQWESYDPVTQTVSELSAIGAPTRSLWQTLCTPYTILVILFGAGVIRAAADNRRLRIAGWLLLIYGALGILWPFAPMHLREALAAGGGTASDTMHLALGAITEIIYLLALGFAAAALGRTFALYSITTFLLLLLFGVLTFMEAPAVSVNGATPYIGVWERINIGVFLLWMIVLSAVLLNKNGRQKNLSVPR